MLLDGDGSSVALRAGFDVKASSTLCLARTLLDGLGKSQAKYGGAVLLQSGSRLLAHDVHFKNCRATVWLIPSLLEHGQYLVHVAWFEHAL